MPKAKIKNIIFLMIVFIISSITASALWESDLLETWSFNGSLVGEVNGLNLLGFNSSSAWTPDATHYGGGANLSKFGLGIKFNGTYDQKLNLSDSALDLTGYNSTIIAWVNETSSDDDEHNGIWTMEGTPEEGLGEGRLIHMGDPHVLRFTSWNGARNDELDFPIAEGNEFQTWRCIAMVANATGKQLWMNGTLVAQNSAGPSVVTAERITVGAAAVPVYFLTGMVDELSIYKRALNGTEIMNYCQQGVANVSFIHVPTFSGNITNGTNNYPFANSALQINITVDGDTDLETVALYTNAGGSFTNESTITFGGASDTSVTAVFNFSVPTTNDFTFRFNATCSGGSVLSSDYTQQVFNRITITQLSPHDGFNNNVNLSGGALYTNAESLDGNCTINVNATVSSVTEEGITTGSEFNITAIISAEQEYSWNITCTDQNENVTTTNRIFTFDETLPVIYVRSNNGFNTLNTTYLNDPLTISVNFTDLNLFETLINITNATNAVKYSTKNTSIDGTFDYRFENIDISSWADGIYTAAFEASDDHTSENIKDYYFVENKNNLEYITEEGAYVKIYTKDDKGVLSTTTKKDKDRYNFWFEFDEVKSSETFYIYSTSEIIYREESDYNAHFIIPSKTGKGGNWIDFEDIGGSDRLDYKVKKINDNLYEIVIDNIDSKEVGFKSLGGLNFYSESYTFTVDNTPPVITFTSNVTANNTSVNQSWILMEVDYTDDNLGNISYVIWNTSQEINFTNYTDRTVRVNFTGLNQDKFYYNVTVIDNASNVNRTETRIIFLDYKLPIISDITNTSENGSLIVTSSNALINATVSDLTISDVILEENSTGIFVNHTITTNVSNRYFFNLSEVFLDNNETILYKWYVNDSVNNRVNSSTLLFTVQPGENNLGTNHTLKPDNFTKMVETQNMTFIINISYGTTEANVSTQLWMNNTGYSATKAASGQFTKFTVYTRVPFVNHNENETNKTFYWDYTLTYANKSSVSYSTERYTMNLHRMILSNCTETSDNRTNTTTLNITIKIEESDIKAASDINSYFKVWQSTPSLYRNYSFNRKNLDSDQICLSPNFANLTVDSIYQINKSGYNPKTHYYNYLLLDNITLYKNIYLTLIPETTLVTFRVRDERDFPLAGVYVKILRFFPETNIHKEVASLKTDSDGQIVAEIIPNTVLYKFIILRAGGEISRVTEDNFITNDPMYIHITAAEDVNADLNTIDEYDYSLKFTNNSKTFQLTFLDTTEFTQEGCLRVTKQVGDKEELLSEPCVSGSLGSISYQITENTTSAIYKAEAYVKKKGTLEKYYLENKVVSFHDTVARFGQLGIYFAIMMFILAIGTTFYSPPMAIIMGIGSLVMAWTVGIVFFSTSVFMLIVIVGIFIVYSLRDTG